MSLKRERIADDDSDDARPTVAAHITGTEIDLMGAFDAHMARLGAGAPERHRHRKGPSDRREIVTVGKTASQLRCPWCNEGWIVTPTELKAVEESIVGQSIVSPCTQGCAACLRAFGLVDDASGFLPNSFAASLAMSGVSLMTSLATLHMKASAHGQWCAAPDDGESDAPVKLVLRRLPSPSQSPNEFVFLQCTRCGDEQLAL